MKRRGRKRSRRNPFGLIPTRSNPRIMGLPAPIVYAGAAWVGYRMYKKQPINPFK